MLRGQQADRSRREEGVRHLHARHLQWERDPEDQRLVLRGDLRDQHDPAGGQRAPGPQDHGTRTNIMLLDDTLILLLRICTSILYIQLLVFAASSELHLSCEEHCEYCV